MKLAFKVVISLLLIFYALRSADFSSIIFSLRSTKAHLIGIALTMIALGYGISALRWQILIKSQNITLSLIDLVKYYLVGAFFNNFLPTTIGGDIVRAYDVSKVSNSLSRSFAVIIIERMTGIFALISYSFVGLILGRETFGNVLFVWVVGGIFFLMLMVMIIGVQIYGAKQPPLDAHTILDHIRMKIYRVFSSLYYFKDKKKIFFKPFSWLFYCNSMSLSFFSSSPRPLRLIHHFTTF